MFAVTRSCRIAVSLSLAIFIYIVLIKLSLSFITSKTTVVELISIILCQKITIQEKNPTAKAELLKLIAAMQQAGFPISDTL